MRRLLLFSILAAAAYAQTAITGTYSDSNGRPLQGTAYVSNPPFTAAGGVIVPAQDRFPVPIVNGVLNVSLWPNDSATPGGTYYTVSYSFRPGAYENWTVPTSATVVNVNAIRGSGAIAIAGNPGGSANQIQYNNGVFGGFTMSGDCTLVVSTGVITCTKSSGVNIVTASGSVTLTNKIFDTAGAGNHLRINGLDLPATSGTAGQTLVMNGGATAIVWGSPGTGTVSSVGLTSMPWLTITNPTTTPTFSATTGQTSHQVIGTCGSATAFAPCLLVAGDLPAVTVLNNQANTFGAFLQDFSGATHIKIPVAAGYTPSAVGHFGYDSTANLIRWYNGAAMKTMASLDSSITGTSAGITGYTIPGTFTKLGTTGVLVGGKCLEADANGNIVVAASNAACVSPVNQVLYTAPGNYSAGAVQLFVPDATNPGIRITPAALPSTPGGGGLAIDSGDANKLKWWNGSSWQTAGSSAVGLGDPGSNSVVYRSGAGTSAPATAHNLSTTFSCAPASASGTAYTCTTSPTFTPGVGDELIFRPDVANTGAATLNVNASSAAPIKKQAGAAALVANDILASPAQYTFVYDGTNWEMQSQTGNTAGGGSATFCSSLITVVGQVITLPATCFVKSAQDSDPVASPANNNITVPVQTGVVLFYFDSGTFYIGHNLTTPTCGAGAVCQSGTSTFPNGVNGSPVHAIARFSVTAGVIAAIQPKDGETQNAFGTTGLTDGPDGNGVRQISVPQLTPNSYVAGAGTAQAQVATLAPAALALTPGLTVKWKPAASNTSGGPTLGVNALTAKTITKCGTTALVANDIATGTVAEAVYDGTQFQLLNPQAAGCGAGATGGSAILTVTGTFTCPSKGWYEAQGWGGGGGGGGGNFAGGYGGPGAGYARKVCSCTPAATVNVTVGTGGAGAAANANPGGNGTDSSISGCFIASGGKWSGTALLPGYDNTNATPSTSYFYANATSSFTTYSTQSTSPPTTSITTAIQSDLGGIGAGQNNGASTAGYSGGPAFDGGSGGGGGGNSTTTIGGGPAAVSRYCTSGAGGGVASGTASAGTVGGVPGCGGGGGGYNGVAATAAGGAGGRGEVRIWW